ncbi:MAG: CBS domain-containing protein [Bacteroidota bacterium]
MSKVSNILARKGSNIISVSPEITVHEALKVMSERNIGSVVVLDNGKYAGLLTERDYARKVILLGRHSNETMVKDIMTTDLPSISRSHTVDDCMQLMSTRNIRYLPVIENNQLVGLLSIMDLVTETITIQKETIDHLQNYISQ